MSRNFGALLLGALAGAIIIHLCYARTLEQLYWDKEQLKVELFEMADRLSRIEEIWADEQNETICAVKFKIEGEFSPFLRLEMQRLAGEITAGLIGSVIGETQPELVAALLHRRIFTVEKKDYLIMVNWVIIAPETLFSLGVSPAP